jgi:hyperosmotically inducible periplasmic protein
LRRTKVAASPFRRINEGPNWRYPMKYKSTLIATLLALATAAQGAFAQEAIPKSDVKGTTSETGEAVTDAWITTKVKTELLATKDVSGTSINVDTNNGVVTLTGNVSSSAEADKAAAVARGIKGVAKVDSQLSVSPPFQLICPEAAAPPRRCRLSIRSAHV